MNNNLRMTAQGPFWRDSLEEEEEEFQGLPLSLEEKGKRIE